jgi:hypothetical protein
MLSAGLLFARVFHGARAPQNWGSSPSSSSGTCRARDVALGVASPLAGSDDAVEAAADCVLRNASSPSGRPIRSIRRSAAKVGSSASRVEKIGEARLAVDGRLHAHRPAVAAPGAPDAICLPGRTAIRPTEACKAAVCYVYTTSTPA